MHTPHPDVTELADVVDGVADEVTTARVATHLRGCAICAAVVDEAKQVLVDDVQPDRAALTERLGLALLPQQWGRALTEQGGTDPTVGQLWRLRVPDPFDDSPELTGLVVVVTAGEDLFVAPVTADSQEGTDLWTVQLAVIGTDLVLAVWVSLAQSVGYEALDVYLGDVDAAAVQSLHRALRRGQQPPAGLILGGPVTPELSEYREGLRSRLTLLGEPRLTDALAEVADEPADIDVVEAIKSAGWDIRRLHEVTGLAPGDARAVLNRSRALPDAQRLVVSNALGVATRATVAQMPSDGWVRAVATPRRRGRFEAVAQRQGTEPWVFRADQLTRQPAARKNAGDDPDWDTLAEQHLRRLESAVGLLDT